MIILEKLISENIKKKIQKDGIDLIDIYEINIMYFVIDQRFDNKIQNLENNFKHKNIELIENILIKNEIEYQYYDKKVINLENIHPEIKNKINDNSSYFKFNDGYIVLGIIKKKLRENLNLKYSLFQITNKQKENLNFDKANCDNINSFYNDPNYNIKVYEKVESEKLNIKIRNELIHINDKVKIKNNNNESLIILCDIDFDYEIVKDRIFSEKIDHFAKQIEKDFVKEKITEYNFQKYE